jgi:hypothetical protein
MTDDCKCPFHAALGEMLPLLCTAAERANEHLRFDDDADEAERRTFLLGDIVQSLGCLSTPELELVAEIANFLTEADVEELETSERGAREADKAATSEGDSAGEVDEEELAAAAAERDSNSPWRLSGPPAANGDAGA